VRHWYSYRSKDRRIKGYLQASNEDGVACLKKYQIIYAERRDR